MENECKTDTDFNDKFAVAVLVLVNDEKFKTVIVVVVRRRRSSLDTSRNTTDVMNK
jgi:hypothetical protein